MTPEEMLAQKVKKTSPEVDAIAEALCDRRMQSIEVVPPSVYTVDDIVDEIEELSAEKREFYLNKFCALVRFFHKRGEDIGSYELSEDIYLYWRKCGFENKAEIWLKCCCDKWERRRAELCRAAAETPVDANEQDKAKMAETLKLIQSWGENDLGHLSPRT